MAQGRAEKDRRHMALEEGLRVKRLGGLLHQRRHLLQLCLLVGVEIGANGVTVQSDGAGVLLQFRRGPLGKGLEHAGAQVEHAPEPVARPSGPIERCRIKGQLGGDLVQQLDRVLRLAVHLVDEGDDGNIA